ncbi:MAG: AmmeMemoRadiSam system protein B, partial [Gammaproteobacteria bacterium]
RVVLMGPAHRVYLQGVAIPTSAQFATPLGLIDVDRQLRDKVSAFPQVSYMDEAFAQEHSLEVHLPFLQTVLDKFTVLPLVVGDTPPDQVAALLESVWGGDETLIVISSDLSHFHDYETARRLDSETAAYIKTLQGEAIESNRACGCMPMHGLLHLARHKNMTVNILDLKNSGDTAGSRDRVVGYGTFSFHEA